MVSNGKYRHWARAFMRTLRRTLKMLRRVHYQYLDSSTYNHMLKKACSRCAKQSRRVQTENKIPDFPKGKRPFKYGLEVPKNWKRIYAATGNTCWQHTVKKRYVHLSCTNSLILRLQIIILQLTISIADYK